MVHRIPTRSPKSKLMGTRAVRAADPPSESAPPTSGPTLPAKNYAPTGGAEDTSDQTSGLGPVDELIHNIPTPVLVGAEVAALVKGLQQSEWANQYTYLAILLGAALYRKQN